MIHKISFCVTIFTFGILYAMEAEHSIINQKSILSAAYRGDLETVKQLIHQKEANDYNGYTALMYASQQGHITVVEELIHAKADVNATEHHGYTALMHACESGQHEIVKILISAGACVNACNRNGKTALMCAAIAKPDLKCRSNIIDELIKAKAQKNAIDRNGYTALDYAKKWGFKETEELLRIYGVKEGTWCAIS